VKEEGGEQKGSAKRACIGVATMLGQPWTLRLPVILNAAALTAACPTFKCVFITAGPITKCERRVAARRRARARRESNPKCQPECQWILSLAAGPGVSH